MLINELTKKLEQKLKPKRELKPKDNSLGKLIAGKFVSILLDTPKNSGVSYQQHLENDTNAVQSAPEEGTPVHKRERVRVGTHTDGKPKYVQVSGDNQDERNDNIVRAYVNSGRILEFIPEWALRPAVVAQPMPEEQPELCLKVLHPFDDYVWNFYKNFKEGQKSEAYCKNLRGRYRFWCKAFKDLNIEEITPEHIQQALDGEKENNISTNKTKLNALKEIFNAAIEDRLIDRNPAKSKKITVLGEEDEEQTVLTPEEYWDIMQNIPKLKDDRDKIVVSLFAHTNLRKGEAVALRWDDIDFKARMISVRRSLDVSHNQPKLKKTKTRSSVRRFPMPDEMYKIFQQFEGREGYVVLNDQGGLFSAQQWDTYWNEKLSKRINLYGRTFRDGRRTYCNYDILGGTDIKTAAVKMGHGINMATTNKFYSKQVAGSVQASRNAAVDAVRQMVGK